MLSYIDVLHIVERIRYKPNTLIRVNRNCGSICYDFTVAHKVPDVNNEEKIDYVHVRNSVAPNYLKNEQDVINYVALMIKRLEMHEMDEWLKLDGKCLNNPHPEIKDS